MLIMPVLLLLMMMQWDINAVWTRILGLGRTKEYWKMSLPTSGICCRTYRIWTIGARRPVYVAHTSSLVIVGFSFHGAYYLYRLAEHAKEFYVIEVLNGRFNLWGLQVQLVIEVRAGLNPKLIAVEEAKNSGAYHVVLDRLVRFQTPQW